MNLNKIFDRIKREESLIRPFSLFLIRALNASEGMDIEERAKWISKAWQHKSKYYSLED